jgi:hypothetical protein
VKVTSEDAAYARRKYAELLVLLAKRFERIAQELRGG